MMPPIARGHTRLCQTLPVSTVPNTGRNQSDSGYRGLEDDDNDEYATTIEIEELTLWPQLDTVHVAALDATCRSGAVL